MCGDEGRSQKLGERLTGAAFVLQSSLLAAESKHEQTSEERKLFRLYCSDSKVEYQGYNYSE